MRQLQAWSLLLVIAPAPYLTIVVIDTGFRTEHSRRGYGHSKMVPVVASAYSSGERWAISATLEAGLRNIDFTERIGFAAHRPRDGCGWERNMDIISPKLARHSVGLGPAACKGAHRRNSCAPLTGPAQAGPVALGRAQKAGRSETKKLIHGRQKTHAAKRSNCTSRAVNVFSLRFCGLHSGTQ
jgi:hypothetical protein